MARKRMRGRTDVRTDNLANICSPPSRNLLVEPNNEHLFKTTLHSHTNGLLKTKGDKFRKMGNIHNNKI